MMNALRRHASLLSVPGRDRRGRPGWRVGSAESRSRRAGRSDSGKTDHAMTRSSIGDRRQRRESGSRTVSMLSFLTCMSWQCRLAECQCHDGSLMNRCSGSLASARQSLRRSCASSSGRWRVDIGHARSVSGEPGRRPAPARRGVCTGQWRQRLATCAKQKRSIALEPTFSASDRPSK
jgi:hypothetical protein